MSSMHMKHPISPLLPMRAEFAGAALHEAAFVPFAQVALLLRYNITTSDATLKQLEDAPLAWKALQKKMVTRLAFGSFLLNSGI